MLLGDNEKLIIQLLKVPKGNMQIYCLLNQ